MLSALKVATDRYEYSRFEPTRSIVKARIVPTPAADLTGEAVTLTLANAAGKIIATRTVTFTGDYPKGEIVELDLTGMLDDDAFATATRGAYTLTATQDTVTAAANIRISLITVEEFKRTYCNGAPLYSNNTLAPKKQPSVVTGVTIRSVSQKTSPGIYALTWDVTNQTFTWGGGIAIELTDENEAILLDTKGGYIEIDIDPFELPAVDASEGILIDKDSVTDDQIRRQIDTAIAEVENSILKVFVEPQRVATTPDYDPAVHDRRGVPQAYYEKDYNVRGLAWHISLPHHQILHMNKLSGYIGDKLALEILSGALAPNRKAGTVDVLPANSQYQIFYTYFLAMNFWGTREFIADFWHYDAIVGIEKTPGDVLKMIGYNAAIPVLMQAGQSFSGGVNSTSISKDGVSKSSSYNQFGVYGAAIQEYKEWIKDNGPKLRNQYRGIPMTVL